MLTTMIVDAETHMRLVALSEATGTSLIETASYIQCELIRSINRSRLIHLLGTVDPEVSKR